MKNRRTRKIGRRAKSAKAGAKDKAFREFEVQWFDDDIHFYVQTKNVDFNGEWRKTSSKDEGCQIDIRVVWGGQRFLAISIPYSKDPRKNLVSLNADINAAITEWIHNHPSPGSKCKHCGCPDHTAEDPTEACLEFLKQKVSRPTVEFRRVATLDRLLLLLRDFRDTAIRCGGYRGFVLRGDGEEDPAVWLSVNLTQEAMDLDGKVPSIDSTEALQERKDHHIKQGRKIQSIDFSKVSGNIRSLLEQLATTDSKVQKRKIRALLRKLGHRGGARSATKQEKETTNEKE